MIVQKNEHLLQKICQALYDKKAKNIITIDVRAISSVTDYFVIAEGTVCTHIHALMTAISEVLDQAGESKYRIEKDALSLWVVIDHHDVIVHLFVPEMRDKYRIEQIWKEGAIVNVPIIIPQCIQQSLY